MHQSPQIAMLQAICSFFIFAFGAWQSWKFDRFNTLKLWKCRSKGQACQLIMVTMYMVGLPLFATQGVVYASIKYKYGWLPPSETGNPYPYFLWDAADKAWIKPLCYLDAVAWACNLTCHFEELAYWNHLTALTAAGSSFFRSPHFLLFVGGSVSGFIVLLTVAGVYADSNPGRSEALVFLIGSFLTLVINLGFFRINRIFPAFLSKWRSQGVAPEIVTRLATFHSMNQVRLGFVMCFSLPIIVLSIDGLTAAHKINLQVEAVDALLMIGLVGFVGQCIITYMIFQPRNIRTELGYGNGLETSSQPSVARPNLSHLPTNLTGTGVTCRQETSQNGPPSTPPMDEKLRAGESFGSPFSDLTAVDTEIYGHPYSYKPSYSYRVSELESARPIGIPRNLAEHISPIRPI